MAKWFQRKRYIIKQRIPYLLNVIALLIIITAYFGFRLLPRQNVTRSVKNDQFVYVTRVIDGDTIKISTGEHVRFIGIDAPESRYNAKLERDMARSRKDMKAILKMGKAASDFVRNLLEWKKVRLEFDVRRTDKYGRLLAYVYLEDGTFVNAKIVEEGYAQVMTIPPDVKYSGTFIRLQKEAREKRKGLWNDVDEPDLF